MGCTSSTPQEEHDVALADYPVNNPESEVFQLAKALRNKGAFDEVDSVYERLLLSTSTSSFEKEYIQLNQLLCRFVSVDTFYLDTTVYSTRFRGLASIINGITLSRKDRSGFETFYKAREFLQEEGLTDSFYYFTLLEQLGLAHMQKGSRLDSVHHYYSNAYLFVKPNRQLIKNRIRLLSRMTLLSLAHRDEFTGLGYIEEALQLQPDKEEKVSFLIHKSTLLRKLKRYEESDQIRAVASEISQQLNEPHILFLLLREQCLMDITRRDSVQFYKNLNQLKELRTIPSINAHLNRLKGAYFNHTGQMEKAVELYEKAFNGFLYEQVPSTQIMFEALTVLTDGNMLLNRLDRAEYYAYKNLVYTTPLHNTKYSFQNAIAPVVQVESYNFIAYDLLGQILLKRYQKTNMQENLIKAFHLYTIIDSLMLQQVRALEDEASMEFLRVGHGIYSNGIETCLHLYNATSSSTYLEAAHRFMERSKSLALYKDILIHDANYFPNVPFAFKQKELVLRMKLSELKSKSLHNQTEELENSLNDLEAYYVEMKNKYPEYYLAHYQQTIQPYSYFRQYSKDTHQSILQYHVSENKLYCLRYDEPALVSVSLTPDLLNQLAAYRKLASTPPSTDQKKFIEFKGVSHKLYEELVKPLGLLKSSVLFVPEGVLSQLPFEALVSDTTGTDYKNLRYLIKEHSISYCYSLKLITEKETPHSEGKILAYGFLASNESNTTLAALPGSIREIEIIKQNFQSHSITSRTGRESSKAQFMDDLREAYDFIHIGLHATSSTDNRFKNCIYFEQNGNEVDTLFGYEIIPLSLKANTVVLTTCESGYGTMVKGEGTFSLARAFQQAGVKNVIASLWALPDYSSPILCSYLYNNIKAGLSPAEALNKAKRQYLTVSDSNAAAPLFWAGLVCFHD
jgi:CHAT domain-containing protein